MQRWRPLTTFTSAQSKDGIGFAGALFYKVGDEHPPDWTNLVNPHLKKAADFPNSQSTSGVLFVHTQHGFYAYTFGVGGRSLLRRDALVPDFGKKTVLSVADPNRLRSIDLRTMRDQPFPVSSATVARNKATGFWCRHAPGSSSRSHRNSARSAHKSRQTGCGRGCAGISRCPRLLRAWSEERPVSCCLQLQR